MPPLTPASARELAAALKDAAAASHNIETRGNGSKRLMGGPVTPSEVVISTSRLNRILQYEPNDLTVSVGAGMPWAELVETLRRQRQMIALDPPFAARATVGGVVATNSSGPLRMQFGTARDLVIGMEFAMLDGNLIRSGGMVVKNVAGLDIAKLLIGSFGTLAVLTSVNFRLHALPEQTDTFLFSFPDLAGVLARRDMLLAGVLRPFALDIVTPPAAARLNLSGYALVVRAGGSDKVLDRYARDLTGSRRLGSSGDSTLWDQIREFPAAFLARQPKGIVLRVSTPLDALGELLRLTPNPCIARAGTGIAYLYFNAWREAAAFWQSIAGKGWPAVIEYAPDEVRQERELWLVDKGRDDTAFAMMKRIKEMFDPHGLLNRSRLYGRI